MPNTVCWICKATTGHTRITPARRIGAENAFGFPVRVSCAAFECQVCGGISVAIAPDQENGMLLNDQFDRLTGDKFAWKPNPGSTLAYPDVPDHIAEAATEAYECGSEAHYRAAILLARAVIEATAKDKGIIKGNLCNKIDELANQNLIRPHIKDVAHGIRLFGNDMAHGDFVAPVSAEESRLIVELMGEILNEVYQSPAKLAAVQQSVAARQGQTN